MRWEVGLSVICAAVTVAPAAHAVIIAQTDSLTVDLLLLPNESAQMTVTYNVPDLIANVARDREHNGDTDQTAEQWQVWASQRPIFYTLVSADTFLESAIPRVISTGGIEQMTVEVYFTVPGADGTEQSRLFQSFDCAGDCLAGHLPGKNKEGMSPWAVQQIRAEANRLSGHN
jgi:hypothetical protein